MTITITAIVEAVMYVISEEEKVWGCWLADLSGGTDGVGDPETDDDWKGANVAVAVVVGDRVTVEVGPAAELGVSVGVAVGTVVEDGVGPM